MSDLRLADVVAALVSTRDRLRAKADHADDAIASLQRLLTDDVVKEMPALSAPRQERPRATSSAPRAEKPHVRVIENRPKAGVCEYAPCGQPFPIHPRAGRPRRYCEAHRMPRARKGADAKQKPARPAEDLDALLSHPDEIAESGSAMRRRIKELADGPAAPRSKFLETVRGRNDDAARRSAARTA